MDTAQLILALVIIASALGVILAKKPVHACLWFLLTLLGLATTYLQLYAPFIAVMQILIYAGAILVLFMFVIVLFQDAYLAISTTAPKTNPWWLALAASSFLSAFGFLGYTISEWHLKPQTPNIDYGSVQALGKALYIDFFFPFEAVGVLFLIAMIGALYIGKKVH